jgi:hypothetical protein
MKSIHGRCDFSVALAGSGVDFNAGQSTSRVNQGREPMKFMCLIYFEPGAFDGVSEAEMTKLTDDTIVEDNDLRQTGHLILGQPLLGPETAVTIRGGKRGLTRTDGPFLETKEWLGGFTLIEARDMDEAIALTKTTELLKYCSIEIRPTLEQTHSETGQARPEAKE